MDDLSVETLTAIAHRYLDPPEVDRWARELRPAVRLSPPDPDDPGQAGDPVVARLGGVPDRLPADLDWPTWEPSGPLTLAFEVDLGAVARAGLDAGPLLPREGRLLAFVPGARARRFALGSHDPVHQEPARLLHVPPDAPLSAAVVPPGTEVLPATPMTARQVTTWPSPEHSTPWQRVGQRSGELLGALDEHLWALGGGWVSSTQLGGWPTPIQTAVEREALRVVHGRWPDGEEYDAEEPYWRSLLQVGSYGEVGWIGGGTLYWLARLQGTAPVRLEDAVLVAQDT